MHTFDIMKGQKHLESTYAHAIKTQGRPYFVLKSQMNILRMWSLCGH